MQFFNFCGGHAPYKVGYFPLYMLSYIPREPFYFPHGDYEAKLLPKELFRASQL